MEDYLSSHIRIERPVYEQEELRREFQYEEEEKTCCNIEWNQNVTVKKTVLKFVPSIGWLTHYRWKQDIVADLISGFTVAIMHIPQGMGYALLGNVPPVTGIYMAFFPVLVYFFLGTSRHNSMGTFAVVCLMTGKAVLEHSDPTYFRSANAHLNNGTAPDGIGYSPTQVGATVSFVVAVIQIIMFSLRLGMASALLSETLVSGFTTGAAIHVFVSQIKDLLGIKIPKHKGFFVVINSLKSLIELIGEINVAALVISSVTIIIIVLNNEVLKPILAKKSSIPVPIELIAVVIGTLASTYGRMPEIYNVATVGEIPSGLPYPEAPQWGLMTSLILDGFTIAVVSYTITLSMGMIFAQKLNYEVDANQELLAMGSSNIFGSFFSCMPLCASLSRSLIQQTVGGKTQIASIVSCTILLCILLWIGPLFEPLPKSVLASIIVVALKGMLMQVGDFFKFLKLSKLDALVWMVTFLTVVIVGVDVGLLVGVLMSLVTIFILGFKPYTCLLGNVPNTDLYLDISKYKAAQETNGLKIFQYSGGINFATKSLFKSELLKAVKINLLKEVIYRTKLAKYAEMKANIDKIQRVQNKVNVDVRCIILDFSSLSYIDPSGVSMLKNVVEGFQKLNIPIYVAACSDPVYEMMTKCDLINSKKAIIRSFVTVQDAVHCAAELFHTNSDSSISVISKI